MSGNSTTFTEGPFQDHWNKVFELMDQLEKAMDSAINDYRQENFFVSEKDAMTRKWTLKILESNTRRMKNEFDDVQRIIYDTPLDYETRAFDCIFTNVKSAGNYLPLWFHLLIIMIVLAIIVYFKKNEIDGVLKTMITSWIAQIFEHRHSRFLTGAYAHSKLLLQKAFSQNSGSGNTVSSPEKFQISSESHHFTETKKSTADDFEKTTSSSQELKYQRCSKYAEQDGTIIKVPSLSHVHGVASLTKNYVSRPEFNKEPKCIGEDKSTPLSAVKGLEYSSKSLAKKLQTDLDQLTKLNCRKLKRVVPNSDDSPVSLPDPNDEKKELRLKYVTPNKPLLYRPSLPCVTRKTEIDSLVFEDRAIHTTTNVNKDNNGVNKTNKLDITSTICYSIPNFLNGNLKETKRYDRNLLMNLRYRPISLNKLSKNLPTEEMRHEDDACDIRILPPLIPIIAGAIHEQPGSQTDLHLAVPDSQQELEKPSLKIVFSSLHQPVKLNETKNAWKPSRSTRTDVASPDALYKIFRGILNKLTLQKFHVLIHQVMELQVDTEETLSGMLDLVFEKAIQDQKFSTTYAMLCKKMQFLEVPSRDKAEKLVSFRKLLLTKCHNELGMNGKDDLQNTEGTKKVEKCDKGELLQMKLGGEDGKDKRQRLGSLRFIGELYNLKIISTPVMHHHVRYLLGQGDEHSLEYLSCFLTTIGEELGTYHRGDGRRKWHYKRSFLEETFATIQTIVDKRKTSSRLRFMLQDLIDLRKNNWVSRTRNTNPKTIDQVREEAEKESHEQQHLLQSFLLKHQHEEPRKNLNFE